MQAREPSVLSALRRARSSELGAVQASALARAALGALLGAAPTLVFAATLLAHAAIKQVG